MTHITQKTALVLGATGGLGGALTRNLTARGWRVRALNRNPQQAQRDHSIVGVTWLEGDAMRRDSVVAAAKDVDLIVHAVNPPGYKNWAQLIGPMMDNSIAAAKASGARILLPGNIYNYGPDAGELISESSPEHPQSRKGKLRVAMEDRLRHSGVKALIVRAGDFYGPGATANNWFGQMVKAGAPVRSVTYPGERQVGHAWAYLPDLAEAMAQLVEREADLESVAVFNFGGSWFERGEDIAKAILRAASQPNGAIRAFPWFAAIAASPVVPMFREILEMRYLWRRPLRLDNTKLVTFLGAEPTTPLETALAKTLDAMSCLSVDKPGGDLALRAPHASHP